MAGINVVRERIIAWLCRALIAGLAGGVFAWYVSVFYPETVFSGEFTIFAIVFALFGGSATVVGPVLGVVILYGIYNAVGISMPQYFQLIYGALIMALVLFLPNGLVSLLHALGHRCPLTQRRCSHVDGLVKRFGGFRALDGLSFTSPPARSSAWSDRTARARPPASTSSPASTRRMAARSGSKASPIGGLPSHRLVHAAASTAPSRCRSRSSR